MEEVKFEWEVWVIWHFPKLDVTEEQLVAQFVGKYDADVCAKALQSICKNKEYVVRKIGGGK